MGRLLLIVAIIGFAGFLDHKASARTRPRESAFKALRNGMIRRMMASMPEGSPPKLVMTILPRQQAQNEDILALLREQNDLLRRLGAARKPE